MYTCVLCHVRFEMLILLLSHSDLVVDTHLAWDTVLVAHLWVLVWSVEVHMSSECPLIIVLLVNQPPPTER